MSRILMVVTSHSLVDGEPRTGVWFTEFSEPFEVLANSGADITVASPRGGAAPVDPRSYPLEASFVVARHALERLNATRSLAQMRSDDYDAIFFPGGHGPMFDLASDPAIKRLVADFWSAGKPVAAVCHGPAALLGVTLPGGSTLLAGRRATSFTHGEDEGDALFRFMPFSLEQRVRGEGATFISEPPGHVHVETDGLLVTGQNPASASATAQALLQLLQGGMQ